MIKQPTLFRNPPPKPDPTKTETTCPMCHRQLLIGPTGVPRHRPGESTKCIDEMRAQINVKKAGGAQ